MRSNFPVLPLMRFLSLRAALCFSLMYSPLLASDPKPTSESSSNVAAEGVLMIGDSMTVGAFGDLIQGFLLARFGRDNVAIYASCGSSPEHWLQSEPEFITKCGYREQTPQNSVLLDFQDGKPPPPTPTPKLENLLAMHRPSVVIVQLGTNWMDAITKSDADESKYNSILNRFIAAINGQHAPVPRIIWITPPDSSHYSNQVKRKVDNLIKAAARTYHFEVIVSSALTHYVSGQTGGDGIHYRSAAAKEWADPVTRQLDRKLR